MSTDPRRRKARHTLTTENLQTCIQVTNIPSDWTIDNVNSVLAGSGRIINITQKNDPRSGKLTYLNYDYLTNNDCRDAYGLLSRIDKFPCNLEMIIPPNYKEKLERQPGNVMDLNRDNYPWSYNLDLPFQMVTNVPLPRRPTSNDLKEQQIVFPDILSKASQHLPAMKTNFLINDNKIDLNLKGIPPLQLIEMLSNLKILANQGISKREQLGHFLKTNDNLVIAVSQSLLEMGFITEEVMNSVLRTTPILNNNSNNNNLNSNQSSVSNTPSQSYDNIQTNNKHNTNTNMQMPIPPPQPFVPGMVPSQPPVPFGFQPVPPVPIPVPTPYINQPASSTPTPTPVPAPAPASAPAPVTSTNDQPPQNNGLNINYTKLQTLPQNQQDMIKQVLTLDDNQLKQLPMDQQTMVINLRKDYLL